MAVVQHQVPAALIVHRMAVMRLLPQIYVLRVIIQRQRGILFMHVGAVVAKIMIVDHGATEPVGSLPRKICSKFLCHDVSENKP